MVTGKKQTKATKAAAKPVKEAAKGKAKAAPPPAKEPTPEPEQEEEDDDDEDEDEDDSEYDSDEDEENGGVSEKGMKRLMELVGPEDLDEFELAQLGAGEDDDEEDEDEEDDDEDEEGEEADDIVIDEADPDTLAVDELGSDVSLDEDAVPQRKLTHNNKPAMRILTEGIKMTHTPWPEHLIVSSKTILDVDPADDLKRETAFYKLALDAVPFARAQCSKHDIPFSRPNDYYAEMVKSDEHMERIRTKLVEESQGIKKSEEAKKQRELKKYGKQIQHEKLKQREADKKSFNEKMAGVKRKRKEGMEIGDEADDDFGVHLEGDDDDRRGGGRGGSGRKPKMPRHARDAKYSLGKSSRRAKQNTRESTNDFAGWGSEKKGKGGKGAKAGANRPGKSKRHSRRK